MSPSAPFRLAVVALALALGGLVVTASFLFGAARGGSAEEAVAAWLRAAQRGDVTRMLELTAESRRDELAEHRVLLRRLVHDSGPAAKEGDAPFTFELRPGRTRYENGSASVIVELSRHDSTVLREYRVVRQEGEWYVERWRNLSALD